MRLRSTWPGLPDLAQATTLQGPHKDVKGMVQC